MSRIRSAILMIVAVALLIGIVGFVGWAIFRGVQEEPSVVASLLTAAAAVVGVVVGQYFSKRLDLKQSHRAKMMPIYDKLFERVLSGALADDDAEEALSEEDKEFFLSVKRSLILYGPDTVVREWNEWMDALPDDPEHEPDGVAMVQSWEKLLLAIRADLGHSNNKLKTGDLLRLYITDYDEVIAPSLEGKGK